MPFKKNMKKNAIKSILNQRKLLRISVSFLFLSFGLWEVYMPSYWNPFFPNIINLSNIIVNAIISIHGILLLIIGLAILFGYKLKAFAAFGTLMMILISLSLFYLSGFTDILMRDITITIAVAALMFD